MTKKTDRLYIRISPEEKNQLAHIAKEERRTLSNLALFAIQEFLKRRKSSK
ncbi:CopG family transcriptional regulator [candidate division KSB1 bacterium]|nr:CopG family transcriptional regulator [candidate division KSB1 bacterium]